MTRIRQTFKKSAVVLSLTFAAIITGCATSNASETVAKVSNAVETTPTASSQTLADITVNVTGFKAQTGAVMAALVDAQGYQGGQPLRGKRVDVIGEAITMNFQGLPAGEYAVRMYHDVNGDGKMNSNAFGIPTEPFAFSNNAAGTMGPAPWSKAKFSVSGEAVVQNISF
jgi:uncharacterized protein (DUF2141 family)